MLVLLPNDVRFPAAFFGAWMAGAVPVPLAWPFTLANAARALAPIRPLADAARASAIATIPELAADWGLPVVTGPADRPLPRVAAPSPGDPAFMQFTSGSLGRPRGAVISHGAVLASAFAMGRAMDAGEGDVGVSWLPLFHDMGLVGALLTPLLFGFPLHLMTPGEFLLHPARWLRRLAEAGGTVSTAPDFAYDLVLRRVKEDFDLSRWRVALDGAEPVHRATLDRFEARFGVRIRPVYGLAENTLGACFGTPGEADLSWLGRSVPSCGGPLDGMTVGIRAGDVWAGEGEEGEVVIRGPALMSGYFEDEASTSAALRDGWLHTGDLGVLRDGRLHVTGREKDLVIQHGRKFHPYDVERVAAIAAEAPPNGVAAFSVAGPETEQLVVVVESRQEEIERRVRGLLLEELGVRADRVVRVSPGELPRTTSGKVRRREAAARFGQCP